MNTSLNNDELYNLLIDTIDMTDADTILDAFKVIRDNNLALCEDGCVYRNNEGILNVSDELDISDVIYEFYNYWLKHNSTTNNTTNNSSSTNNSGFIDLRC